jgi:hypothetical protein
LRRQVGLHREPDATKYPAIFSLDVDPPVSGRKPLFKTVGAISAFPPALNANVSNITGAKTAVKH